MIAPHSECIIFIFTVVNPPTPHYNNTIMFDLITLRTNILTAEIVKEYPNIRDGIILLKIWLKQRQLCNNFESFNGHIITMYVLYLIYTKKLNTFMSSYQILRNTWQHLGNKNIISFHFLLFFSFIIEVIYNNSIIFI